MVRYTVPLVNGDTSIANRRACRCVRFNVPSSMSPITLRIRELREARGWTQAELAERAELRRATIADMEGGKTRGVDFASLEALAHALNVAPAYLITETADRPGTLTARQLQRKRAPKRSGRISRG